MNQIKWMAAGPLNSEDSKESDSGCVVSGKNARSATLHPTRHRVEHTKCIFNLPNALCYLPMCRRPDLGSVLMLVYTDLQPAAVSWIHEKISERDEVQSYLSWTAKYNYITFQCHVMKEVRRRNTPEGLKLRYRSQRCGAIFRSI